MDNRELEINEIFNMDNIEKIPIFDMVNVLYEVDLFVNNTIVQYCAKNKSYDRMIITLETLENVCRVKRLLLQARTRAMKKAEEAEAHEVAVKIEQMKDAVVPEAQRTADILKGAIGNDNSVPKGKQTPNKGVRRSQEY